MNDILEIHALSGAYAVDALDDLERARFERHLTSCAECRAEVAGLIEAASQLSNLTAAEPSEDLRSRVLSSIATVRPFPPDAPVVPARPAARHLSRGPRALLAAAAAAVVLGLGALTWHPWTTAQQQQSLASQVVHSSDARSQRVSLASGGTVWIVDSASMGRVAMVTSGISAPPPGKVYEMWLQNQAGIMKPAGLLTTGGSQTVIFNRRLNGAVAAAITLEPAGGSTVPTSNPIAAVTL